MKYGLRIAALLVTVAIASSLYAQDKDNGDAKKEKGDAPETVEEAKKQDPSKLFVDLSGKMYLLWGYNHGFNNSSGREWGKLYKWGINATGYDPVGSPTFPYGLAATTNMNYSAKKSNTFQVERAYLTLKKRIGEWFSIKVTTDINPSGQDFIFLKYGFLQFYKDFGPVGLKAQFGKIGTPVIGMADQLSDMRWIHKDYLLDSKTLLNGKSFDNSADLGMMVSLQILQWVRVEYALTNGEGYKQDGTESYDGKSHTVLISATPIKHAYVNLYGRYEPTQVSEVDTSSTTNPIFYRGHGYRYYLGVGLAWSSDLIKVGANFFMPEKKYPRRVSYNDLTAPSYPSATFMGSHRRHYYLLDSWLNVDLGSVTPAGILILGRWAWGKELKSLVGNLGESRETIALEGGLGYKFSKYLQMAAYYQHFIYRVNSPVHNPNKKNPDDTHLVYIKVEAKY